jgi:hypothetical protein
MIYYSTGVSPFMRKKGQPIECFERTAESLIKKGYLVTTIEELETNTEVVDIKENAPVELEQKKVYKPKGRPKRK